MEVARDITKVVRVGVKDDYLGTVKVEMFNVNDASRASIMKNKNNLGNHQNHSLKILIIKSHKVRRSDEDGKLRKRCGSNVSRRKQLLRNW